MCPFWSIISTEGGGGESSALSLPLGITIVVGRLRFMWEYIDVECVYAVRKLTATLKLTTSHFNVYLCIAAAVAVGFFFCLGWRLLFLLEAVFYSVFSAIYLVEFIEVIAIPCDSMILLYGMRLAAWDLHPKKKQRM